jgi:plastocyanin
MRRTLLVPGIAVAGVIGLATLLGGGAAAAAALAAFAPAPAAPPVAWQAHTGAQSDGESLQALAFFPTDVFVNVGDSITWHFDAAEPHTVTFLQPGQAPPAAGTPPSPSNVFTGSNFVNSGLLTGPGAAYTVVFDTPGDYAYLCLLHRVTMSGRVHVNPAGSPYPHTQADYDRQASGQTRLTLEDGRDIRRASLDAANDAGRDHVVTGGGDGQVFVASFLPQQRRIRVGQTVVWSNPDSITPHTVTFGPAPSNAPAGLDGAGHATISANPVTSTISSGLIGVRRPLGSDFAVTFTAPGTYPYFCSLHRDLGMTGTIVVVPNGET